MGKATSPTKAKKAAIPAELRFAAASGLPETQRDVDRLVVVDAPTMTGHSRTASSTVQRLTRVELLARSGVLEPHEAQACAWYADTTALAWDTTGCTANYEGGGGGGSAHAPDRLMARQQDIADARDDYLEARRMLGGPLSDAFEAIVCRNEAMGPTAAAAFPQLGRSAAHDRLRSTVKLCANKLHERFGKLMGWDDAPMRAASAKTSPAAPSAPPVPANETAALEPAVAMSVLRAQMKGEAPDQIWIARACHDALVREMGADVDEVCGLPLVVREDWRWGYVAVVAQPEEIAA